MTEAAGDEEVIVAKASGHNNLLRFNTNTTATLKMSFGEFLRTYKGGASRKDLLYMHPNSPSLNLDPGAAGPWNRITSEFDLPSFSEYMPPLTRSTLWIGAANTSTATHFDYADNILSVVRGQKTVHLFDPSQSPFLYRSQEDHSLSDVPRVNQVPRADFPLFEFARGHSIVVNAGEALFLPSFWWHQVDNAAVDHETPIVVSLFYTCHSELLRAFAHGVLGDTNKDIMNH